MRRSGAAGSGKLKTACALALALAVGGLLFCDAISVKRAGADTARGESQPSLGVTGSIVPSTLPRAQRAPVTVRVGFTSAPAGGRVPKLSSLALQITRNVAIQAKGLPSCPLGELFSSYADPATVCRNSLIGHGVVTSEIILPGQTPAVATGKLLAFYSVGEGGPRVLADVRTETPPLNYVIPFELEKAHGPFGTRLVVHKMRTINGICIKFGSAARQTERHLQSDLEPSALLAPRACDT